MYNKNEAKIIQAEIVHLHCDIKIEISSITSQSLRHFDL